ncbi:flagellar protein FlgJ [Pseudomonas duriflava]|uniref:Peptidoglycan hydrolase FlgJ n=1 Tax=Pseudomonas duriflava TaxID=459528 RepID=A0A562QBK9_9PSED|nr:flagellar assembly peptidoglycan hydrolase FlgJ [Pseudomonas duriflava]TWI53570.1 flagellar protein FlgJ [Pseudomonas duriflava]
MDSRLGGTYSSNVDSGAYTDLNRLAQMKGKNRDSEENIKKVAQEFESLFLNQMMKSMRSANEVLADKDSPFQSETTKQYQSMYDQQMSISLAREGGGLGLASVLERQLSKTNHGPSRPNPFAQVGQGSPAPADIAKAQAQDKVVATNEPTSAGRDDSKLLNMRRLALPGKLVDRVMAGIVPDTSSTTTATRTTALAQNDWKQTQALAGTADRSLKNGTAQDLSVRRYAQPPLAVSSSSFSSRQDFIDTMLPMAENAAKRIGVDPRYLVAQAALETGWGKSIIRQQDGSSSHNLFGIKAHGWQGGSARAVTTEFVGGQPVKEVAKFRAYDSFADSFNDYVSFLQSNQRYQKALSSGGDSEKFMKGLQQAGYATDPQYARKITQIAQSMNAYQSIAALDNKLNRS